MPKRHDAERRHVCFRCCQKIPPLSPNKIPLKRAYRRLIENLAPDVDDPTTTTLVGFRRLAAILWKAAPDAAAAEKAPAEMAAAEKTATAKAVAEAAAVKATAEKTAPEMRESR